MAAALALFFGAGKLKPAPGTWGSLAAIPPGVALSHWGGPITLAAATLAISLVGIWASERYSADLGIKDPSEVVIDEVAGLWLALLFVPASLAGVFVAFLFFRLFDTWKPFPVGWLDRNLTGGLGIMADDWAAGLMAGLAAWGVLTVGYPVPG